MRENLTCEYSTQEIRVINTLPRRWRRRYSKNHIESALSGVEEEEKSLSKNEESAYHYDDISWICCVMAAGVSACVCCSLFHLRQARRGVAKTDTFLSKLPCTKTQLIFEQHYVVNNMEVETIDVLSFVEEIVNSNEVLDGLRHLLYHTHYLWRICFLEVVGHLSRLLPCTHYTPL